MVEVIPTNLGIVIKIQIVMSVLKSGIHIDNVDSFAGEAEIPCIQDPHSIVSDMPSLIPSGKLKESLIKLSSKFEMMHLKLTKDQSETKLKLFEQSKLTWTAGKRKKKCTTKWQKKEFSFDLAKCWWDPWSDWSATCRLVQVADELFPFYLHFFVLSRSRLIFTMQRYWTCGWVNLDRSIPLSRPGWKLQAKPKFRFVDVCRHNHF